MHFIYDACFPTDFKTYTWLQFRLLSLINPEEVVGSRSKISDKIRVRILESNIFLPWENARGLHMRKSIILLRPHLVGERAI